MASLNSVQLRKNLASGKVVQRVDDTSIAIRVRHLGTGASPSVVMTTATKVAMTQAAATVDYAWTDYATMGALAAALNASGLWEAKLLDCLGTDVTLNSFKSNTTIAPSTDENGVVVWDFLHDNTVQTNSSEVATVCLSPYFNFDAPDGHRVHIQELAYCQDVSAAEAGAVRVYERDAKSGTEVLLWKNISVDSTGGTTVTTHTFASGEGMISSGENRELIFRVQDTTSISSAAGNLVRITGLLE